MNALLGFGRGAVSLWTSPNLFCRRILRPGEAAFDGRLSIASEGDHGSGNS
jgi:hypothetical protein